MQRDQEAEALNYISGLALDKSFHSLVPDFPPQDGRAVISVPCNVLQSLQEGCGETQGCYLCSLGKDGKVAADRQ